MIAIGNDHAAVALKEEVKNILSERNIEFIDCGVGEGELADYPLIAEKVCRKITDGVCEKGILMCGTGIGMSIAANKIKGIRASVCSDVFSAKMTVMHNDSNVLCLGERVIGKGLMREIVEAWLDASFEGGRHSKRVDMIKDIENRILN